MRTLNLIAASLTTSLLLANAATAAGTNTELNGETAARMDVERDYPNFVCGTPDEIKEEEIQRALDQALAEVDIQGLVAIPTVDAIVNTDQSVKPTETVGDVIPNSDDSVPASANGNVDLTADGFVNVDDILMVLQGWGGCAPMSISPCIGDVNSDGYVDQRDLLMLFMNWN